MEGIMTPGNDGKPRYLGTSGIAARIGTSRANVVQLLAGTHPLDNDAWGPRGEPLWLPETVDAWRDTIPLPQNHAWHQKQRQAGDDG